MKPADSRTALIFWLFGLPSAGKTALACAFCDHHRSAGRHTVLLECDELRSGLCTDLGFSDADRSENLRRAAHLARSHADAGSTVICAFITPREQHRADLRQILGTSLRLIFIDCPLAVCIARDTKGLYARAAAGQMQDMIGTQAAFEPPAMTDGVMDTVISTYQRPLEESFQSLLLWSESAQRAKSKEQRAKSKEQRAKSKVTRRKRR